MSRERARGVIERESAEFARRFREAAASSHNEAEFQRKCTNILEDFAKKAGFGRDFLPREEYTLINGRADAVYNRFLIEYERPGSLRDRNSYHHNQHAIGQVKRYLEGLERRERRKMERLAGVVFDGHYFIFVRQRESVWHIDDPLPVDTTSTRRFLRTLVSLSTELALVPENLIRDFGEKSKTAEKLVRALYEALTSSNHQRVKILFKQWSEQFSEVCDYAKATKLNVSRIAKSYGIQRTSVEPFRLFFCIHTYYAILIKLLSVLVAHFYLTPKMGASLAHAATLDPDRLKSYLQRIEDGGIFKEYYNLNNFLEGDFFTWYLDVWNDDITSAVKHMLSRLSDYSVDTLDVAPEVTRDLLKQIYQNLMPKALRHNLGEYYTPDWLAERLLNQLGYHGELDKRLLDPACGSGTFLVLAIQRLIKKAREEMLSEEETLRKVLNNIVGFDLNPLAVISARTNYLLAIGELLKYAKEPIDIPVYLCDSIITPQKGEELFTERAVSFPTVVGNLAVPLSLVDARYIDQLATLLEESVKSGLSAEQFRKRLLNTFPLLEKEDARDIEVAVRLFQRISELEKQGINGIWARIIKNAFAPIFQGKFDLIAGNPPWINWEHLPEEYRLQIARSLAIYGLSAKKGKKSDQFELGKKKTDISYLMTVVSIDKYLKDNGRLGFLITQTLFKSGAGQGFRRLVITKRTESGIHQTFLRVVGVDDLSSLQPFEGATNRTAVVVIEKGKPTRYPVGYNFWRKITKGSIPTNASLDDVLERVKVSQWQAEPVNPDDSSSPWLTGRPKAVRAIRKIIGRSAYRAREGCNTGGLNGAYWVQIVRKRPDGMVVIANLHDVGRKEVEPVQAAIEPDLLYPLLRGRDVSRWRAKPSAFIVLPHTPETDWRAIDEEYMAEHYPKTYNYFVRFKQQLLSRSGYRLLRQGHPFYTIVDIHSHTFAPYKVVWRGEVAPVLTVAVCSPHNRTVIPDQTCYFTACNTADEAHFLCSILNSSPVQLYYCMRSYKHASMKFVSEMSIPSFSPDEKSHTMLANLSEEAHRAAETGDTKRLAEVEAEIDELAAELWGLTATELRDIQTSLKELLGKET